MATTADTAGELEVVVDPSLESQVDNATLAAEFDAIMAGGEPEPVADMPAPVAAPKVETPAAAAAPPADDEPEVVKQIRAREQAQKIRDVAAEEAKAAAAQIIAEAKAEAEKERAAAKAEAEAQRKQQAEQFRADPLKAINELGIDKRTLVDGVVKSDDPIYRQQQELAALRAQVEALTKTPAAAATEFAQWRQQQEQQAAAATRARTEQDFIASAKTAIPELYAAMEQSAAALAATGIQGTPSAEQLLLQRGYQYAQEMERALGRVASNAELVQYVSHVERQRAASAAGAAGKPTVGRVTGSRTLSGQAAVERRSPPRPDAIPTREELAAEFDAMLLEERAERRAGRR